MSDDPSPALLSLREFLTSKADEFGVRDRHRRRREWLQSVHRFMERARCWLAEADPEEILDIQPYQVSRTEMSLGTYDAPALQISFGPGEAQIIPIDRYISSASTRYVSPLIEKPSGRIDITDGSRKTPLYRVSSAEGEQWRFVDDQGRAQTLDKNAFARIIQDLLS